MTQTTFNKLAIGDRFVTVSTPAYEERLELVKVSSMKARRAEGGKSFYVLSNRLVEVEG